MIESQSFVGGTINGEWRVLYASVLAASALLALDGPPASADGGGVRIEWLDHVAAILGFEVRDKAKHR